MSDIITNFANMQSQRVNPLSKLGTGISGIAGILKQKKLEEQQALAAEQAKLAYDNALINWQADPTLENQTALWQATPEGMQKGLSSLFESASEEEKLGKVQFYNDILGYTSAGEIDLAIESALAGSKAFNTADPRNSKISATIAEKLKEGDIQGAQTFINQMLMSTPEGQELLGTRIDMDTSERADKQLALDETASEMEILKLADSITFDSLEDKATWINNLNEAGFSNDMTNKLANMTRIIEDTDYDLTEEQKRSAENAIADEYWNMTEDYRITNQVYSQVISAAERGNALQEGEDEGATGVADLELVMAMTRMIDPGATVRQDDVNNAMKTAGAGQGLITSMLGVFDGRKLNTSQRNEIMKLAERTREASNSILDQAELFLTPRIDAQGLNKDNIFIPRDGGNNTLNLGEVENPLDKIPEPIKTNPQTTPANIPAGFEDMEDL